jgi:alpha-beta hydrolase superfamily lysophospholipase
VLRVRQLAPGRPLTLVGQSFGGSILAALLSRELVRADRLVFCAPALGQQRARHSSGTLAATRMDGGLHRVAVRLEDEDYTDVGRYLDFMANDGLMVRQITRSTRAAMVALEDLYMRSGPWTAVPESTPVYFVRPEDDAIIDLEQSWRVLGGLTERALVLGVDRTRHYVEFSEGRDEYWNALASIAIKGVA